VNWLLNVYSRRTTTNARKERCASFPDIASNSKELTTGQDNVARRAYIQSEVTETLRSFYCTVCEKQFKNVAQYDEHCNSYAHHHKIRFKEMQWSERAKANSQGAIEMRREKERKREEKELRKAAKAAGVKLSTVTPAVSTVSTVQNPVITTPGPTVEPIPAPLEKKSGFTGGGWSTVSSSSGGGFKKSGWATVSSPPKPLSPPPPPSDPPHVTSIPPPPMTPASPFRSGGWTTLEGAPSTSSPNRPLTPNMYHPTPPRLPSPPPPEPSKPGFGPILITEKPTQIQPQPMSQPAKNPSASKKAESARSGWQSFSRGGSRR